MLRDEQLDSVFAVRQAAESKARPLVPPGLYTQRCYVFERRGKLDAAVAAALRALAIGEELDNLHDQAQAYSDLSGLFCKQGKLEQTIVYASKSIWLFEEWGPEDLGYNFTLYLLATMYQEKGNFVKAMAYFERAITDAERYGFFNNLSNMYITLTDLYTISA